MVDLEDVPLESLRNALADVEAKKPTQRLTAAIAHRRGVPQTEIATWYGVERKTVYNWLTRFERAESLAAAARDDAPPGRPRRLTTDQRETLATVVRDPPEAAGFAAPAWTPDLVVELVEDRWNVTYSRATGARLLREAGLRYRREAGGWELPETAD